MRLEKSFHRSVCLAVVLMLLAGATAGVAKKKKKDRLDSVQKTEQSVSPDSPVAIRLFPADGPGIWQG